MSTAMDGDAAATRILNFDTVLPSRNGQRYFLIQRISWVSSCRAFADASDRRTAMESRYCPVGLYCGEFVLASWRLAFALLFLLPVAASPRICDAGAATEESVVTSGRPLAGSIDSYLMTAAHLAADVRLSEATAAVEQFRQDRAGCGRLPHLCRAASRRNRLPTNEPDRSDSASLLVALHGRMQI